MEANRNEKPRGEYEPWRLTEGRQGAGGMIGWAHRKVNELLADARDVMRGRASGVEEEDHCTDEANKQRGQEPVPARRSFPVPDGLAPLLVRLWDESRTSIRAEFRLWKILAAVARKPVKGGGSWCIWEQAGLRYERLKNRPGRNLCSWAPATASRWPK